VTVSLSRVEKLWPLREEMNLHSHLKRNLRELNEDFKKCKPTSTC